MFSGKWTLKEDNKLRKLWQTAGTDEILRAFSDRTEQDIAIRAKEIGLWPEEVEEEISGTFKIKDREFGVEEAYFSATIDDAGNLVWYFGVTAEEKEYDGEIWQPRAYIEKFPLDLNIRSLDDLLKTEIKIKKGSELAGGMILPGGPNACLYVFEHEWLNNILLKFVGRRGSIFDVEWTAKCDVGWSKKYSTNLDMHIVTSMEFQGIWMRETDKRKARRLLAKHINPDELEYVLTEDGKAGGFLLPNED